ncbi:MAG TPA: restriction endonuclease subunit S, partial [Anaerolineales bacterium]|nr:restriction endonuclease subunit S [Anaerolineales bacterium]
ELPPLTAEELADLPALPEGWAYAALETISFTVSDGDHQAPPKADEGIPFITISNIKNNVINFSDTKYVPQSYFDALSPERKPMKGDILYTVTGSFGIPSLVNFNLEFCFQRHIGLIRPTKSTNVLYLYYLLTADLVYKQALAVATGTAQKTVPLSGLREFKLPVPCQNEQHQIVQEIESRFSVVEKMEQTIDESLQKAEALRQSILKRAFEGKLVPQDPTDEPASELLARIRAERGKVPATGRKKKEAAA